MHAAGAAGHGMLDRQAALIAKAAALCRSQVVLVDEKRRKVFGLRNANHVFHACAKEEENLYDGALKMLASHGIQQHPDLLPLVQGWERAKLVVEMLTEKH